MPDIFKNFDGTYSNLDDMSIYSDDDINSTWCVLRLKIIKELGFALFYMEYIHPNWDRQQEERVKKLCEEFMSQGSYVEQKFKDDNKIKLFYLKFSWKVMNEIENMC